MVESYDDMNEREPSELVAGRFIGLVVFLAGIALLVLAFILVYQAFRDPNVIVPLKSLTSATPTSPSVVYLTAGLRLLLLFIMGYLGSLIAARGAQLFFTARREGRRGLPGD